MWIRTLLSCVFLITAIGASAQYSDNREKFVKEMHKAMTEYGRGESASFVKNKLEPMLIESTKFPDDYFSRMVATCNKLVEKRFSTYPELFQYVRSVYAFVDTEQSKQSYTAWHETVDKLIENRNKDKFSRFIEFSEGFFTEQKISESSDFSWYYIGGAFEFEIRKNAVVNFSGGDLVCRVESNGVPVDSIHVRNTKGIYDPALKNWVGTGGEVTWERVGLDPFATHAELSDYKASMKRSTLSVDTVSLTTPYFDYPIDGRLTERASKSTREEDKNYPQFLSFEQTLAIDEVLPNIDYVGGFEMKGANFYGTGTNETPSSITIKENGKNFITARSAQIIINSRRITIGKAETSIYLKSGDSLYHPGADFLFDLMNQFVQISRTNTGIGQAPFINSYHQLEMYVARLKWDVGTEAVMFTYEFGTGDDKRIARFESSNYFNERLYDQLQGLSTVHPLVAISDYAYKYDEEIMATGKAASAMGLTKEQAMPILVQLANLGFVNHDPDKDLIYVNPKLTTFVKAKAGTKDYDNIVFIADLRPKAHPMLEGKTPMDIKRDSYLTYLDSLYTAINTERRMMKNYARMDLSTLNLNIFAVDNVSISKFKNTTVLPEGNEVLVRKNRDFNFTGLIFSGKLEVYALEAHFIYDDFTFQLLKTTESFFNVNPLRKEDGPGLVKMISPISNVKGALIVDHKNNKSGKNPLFDMFPRLVVENNPKLFYNDKGTFRGAYDSTRFYYTLDAFTKDSLHVFVDKNFMLTGKLTSAGIFPVMSNSVKVMPDYSFGFTTEAPEGGHEFYGTEAKYDNKIMLSSKGLQGAGTIDFLHSSSQTLPNTLFSFLPDSTVGIVKFVNRANEVGTPFPPVDADEAYISYVPKKELLRISSMPSKYLNFFDGEAKMRGRALLQPTGMTGRGLMDMPKATLISNDFSFTRWDMMADTSSFQLKNKNRENLSEPPLTMNTKNMSANISFKERTGTFLSNQGTSEIDFPVNQYRCFMDRVDWHMDNDELAMTNEDDEGDQQESGVEFKSANFFCTNPDMDSLSFSAPITRLNTDDKTLTCEKVEYLDIADARIFPDSMKIVIRKKAKMDKLHNSKITANYITQHHHFERAEIDILGRRKYKASGYYPYYDVDSNVFYVEMNNIRPDTTFETRASGTVKKDEGFKLSPKFDYYGSVSIAASSPGVFFKGATRINHNCDKFDKNWLAFDAEIDPANIQIPVSNEMKDLDGKPVSAGIVWRDSRITDSIAIYPTFLSQLIDAKDPVVLTSSGVLQYDADAKEFQIGSQDKLINRMEPGNYVALHTESCSMIGEGEIFLGMNYGPVEIDAVGVANYNQSSGKTTMNLTMKMNLPIDKGLLEGYADRLNETEGLQTPSDLNMFTIDQAIRAWDDSRTADEFKAKFVEDGEIKKIPKGAESPITLTGVKLISYSGNQKKGLITQDQRAVIVGMYGKPVMKYVPFNAFFQQLYSEQGDEFSMLIDVPMMDCFMGYKMDKKDGTLKILTGDEVFKTAMSQMKDDKLKSKNFRYELTSSSIYKLNLTELIK